LLARLRRDGAAIQAASGKAEEEPIAELWATTTTPPVVVWAPIRAAEDLRDPVSPVPGYRERRKA
jgi:hypothetical protein